MTKNVDTSVDWSLIWALLPFGLFGLMLALVDNPLQPSVMFPLLVMSIAWVSAMYRLEEHPTIGILMPLGLFLMLLVGLCFDRSQVALNAAAFIGIAVLLVRFETTRMLRHSSMGSPMQEAMLEPFVSVEDTTRIEHLRRELLEMAKYAPGSVRDQATSLAQRLYVALTEDMRELDVVLKKVEAFFDQQQHEDVSLCRA